MVEIIDHRKGEVPDLKGTLERIVCELSSSSSDSSDKVLKLFVGKKTEWIRVENIPKETSNSIEPEETLFENEATYNKVCVYYIAEKVRWFWRFEKTNYLLKIPTSDLYDPNKKKFNNMKVYLKKDDREEIVKKHLQDYAKEKGIQNIEIFDLDKSIILENIL